MKSRLTWLLALLVIVIIGAGYFFWYQYSPVAKINLGTTNKPIVNTDSLANKLLTNQNREGANDSVVISKPVSKPDPTHFIKILNIPFTPQAPYANWDLPYQDACEEAAMLMVGEYFLGNRQLNLDASYADQEILKLVEWQKVNRGFYESTTAQEVASILKDYYQLASQVVAYDPEKIRQEILLGHPVILPTAGRLLGNPYFRSPGPIYHMLVVKGYEGNEFITNDPGTKRGLNYRYQVEDLNRAVHDWNNGDTEHGEQLMIVVWGLENSGP